MKSKDGVVAPFEILVDLGLRPPHVRQRIFPANRLELDIMEPRVNLVVTLQDVPKLLALEFKTPRRSNEHTIYGNASRHGC